MTGAAHWIRNTIMAGDRCRLQSEAECVFAVHRLALLEESCED
jgi:hypothetical protein